MEPFEERDEELFGPLLTAAEAGVLVVAEALHCHTSGLYTNARRAGGGGSVRSGPGRGRRKVSAEECDGERIDTPLEVSLPVNAVALVGRDIAGGGLEGTGGGRVVSGHHPRRRVGRASLSGERRRHTLERGPCSSHCSALLRKLRHRMHEKRRLSVAFEGEGLPSLVSVKVRRDGDERAEARAQRDYGREVVDSQKEHQREEHEQGAGDEVEPPDDERKERSADDCDDRSG